MSSCALVSKSTNSGFVGAVCREKNNARYRLSTEAPTLPSFSTDSCQSIEWQGSACTSSVLGDVMVAVARTKNGEALDEGEVERR